MSVEDSSATRLEASVAALSSSSFDEGGFTPGTVLQGRYRIVGLIGRGGMGEVYRSQDLKLGQSVALKFLPEDVQRDAARLERFLGEVRIARQISHPNVCRVYDVGEIEGRHFLSMEFVDGEDLASLLRRIGRLPADKGVEIARQLCAGLAAAHDRGVLHRDLKPANVMIDGRGHARLADFGLAAASDDTRATAGIAGTPAYMAPEQLEGQELSPRSDIYALGLVLHELFTGKRVFESSSVHELREQHRQRSGSRASLASSTFDLDPAIDRVIRRCLEPDPRNRPASALSVAAALPGGDPLAAALAAGETPSPELIAESGASGRLSPAVAWGLLAAVIVGVVSIGWLAGQVRFYRLLPWMRSPEVLAARAEDVLDAMGHASRRADRVYGWRREPAVAGWIEQNDRSPDRWDRLAQMDTPYVYFWYRQSPTPIVPYDSSGSITPEDPPLAIPGMANVTVSPRGRLLSFAATPPSREREAGTPAATATDWAPLFTAAGIDRSTLTPVAPRWTPPSYADHREAWEGSYAGRTDWPMRIEAASYGGRPTWFQVMGPWALAAPGDPSTQRPDLAATLRTNVQVLVLFSTLVVGAWLARRNHRAGRADNHGAVLVAAAASLPMLLGWLFRDHHAGNAGDVWARFMVHAGFSLYWFVLMWLVYLALEPEVRRRWPEAMVSWTRVLVGRVTDPLVARDILVGVAGGVAVVLSGDLLEAVPAWLGQTQVAPTGGNQALVALGNAGAFVSVLLGRLPRLLSESLLILLMLLLLHIVLRNRWLAYVATGAFFFALSFNREALVLSAIAVAALVAIMVLLLVRFGVLAYAMAWFTYYCVYDLPLTLDTSAWYAQRSAVTAGLIVGAAAWGFYWSIAGRPVATAIEHGKRA